MSQRSASPRAKQGPNTSNRTNSIQLADQAVPIQNLAAVMASIPLPTFDLVDAAIVEGIPIAEEPPLSSAPLDRQTARYARPNDSQLPTPRSAGSSDEVAKEAIRDTIRELLTDLTVIADAMENYF